MNRSSKLALSERVVTRGYVRHGGSVEFGLYEHSGTRFDASNSLLMEKLLSQPAVRTTPRRRIRSDEEERIRSGYDVTTAFRFEEGARHQTATVNASDDQSSEDALLEVTYAPAAQVWRVNHGWKRSNSPDGFGLDGQTGRLLSPADSEAGHGPSGGGQVVSGVKLFVRENRNLMLTRVPDPPPRNTDRLFTTLLYALKRGVQLEYQVEEDDLAAGLIGEGEHLRLLFFESAEGGTGVCERLMEEPDAFSRVAARAIELCHWSRDGEEQDDTGCTAACYECLLAYSNQPQHRLIDRRLIRDFP